MSNAAFLVPSRYCGPPHSGNGGWVSGHLVAALPDSAATSRVRLSSPPPLDRDMTVTEADGGVELRDGDHLVASARPVDALPTGIPGSVSFADAKAAETAYEGLTDHPFPTCYSCGTDRDPADALCLRPGPVGDVLATSWVPRVSTLEDVWAALDCPGAWAIGIGGRPMVLGTMTAEVDALPEVGGEHVVVAWAVGSEGRKHHCGTALYAGERLLAHAQSTWIAVDPASVRPAGSTT